MIFPRKTSVIASTLGLVAAIPAEASGSSPPGRNISPPGRNVSPPGRNISPPTMEKKNDKMMFHFESSKAASARGNSGGEEYELRVMGPRGVSMSSSFRSEEDISFTPSSMPGGGSDGLYKFELVELAMGNGENGPPAASDGKGDGRNPGSTPRGPRHKRTVSGAFTVVDNSIVDPNVEEQTSSGSRQLQGDSTGNDNNKEDRGASGLRGSTSNGSRRLDTLFFDDVIATSSMCVGVDCVDGEAFGFDTLRLKENNLRIHFQDTSSYASFPNVDWEIAANDSVNGGLNRFAIVERENAVRVPFSIEAGAPTDSLWVGDNGNVGFGTPSPAVELHTRDGDTPTLRLEQDGSNGFAAQTWDIAGNEANFFVRDVTNQSHIPFKIYPGAPTDSLTVRGGGTGYIGIGTRNPAERLHIRDINEAPKIRLDALNHDWDIGGNDDFFFIQDADDTSDGENATFKIMAGAGANSLVIDSTSDATFSGDVEAKNIAATANITGVDADFSGNLQASNIVSTGDVTVSSDFPKIILQDTAEGSTALTSCEMDCSLVQYPRGITGPIREDRELTITFSSLGLGFDALPDDNYIVLLTPVSDDGRATTVIRHKDAEGFTISVGDRDVDNVQWMTFKL